MTQELENWRPRAKALHSWSFISRLGQFEQANIQSVITAAWLLCLPGVDQWIPDMQKQSERNLEVEIVQIKKERPVKSPIAK